ncbi:hypothetical protein V5T82_15305 [Magnetovibrio sp. PR-2]|uniref:hypothetical protein n=1 Tax=Magnetovibrio sp. PR-2 TaxID=3120356 RepID=UPI002FCE36CA
MMKRFLKLCATTIVASIATFSVASAQSTQQTAADLLDALGGIPGVENLPVSDIQTGDGYTSAHVTLHGEGATIVGFTVDGQKMAAIIPDSFDLTKITPIPSGTPLDNVSFQNMAFVIVPKGGAKSDVTVANLPADVASALSPSGNSVNLKAGLHLYGEMDVTGSAIETMLSPVGITELNLPLSGGFPTSLFSQNPKTAAADFKNQILDNLDINVPLPAVSLPGVPSAVTLKQTNLHITGKKDGTARVLDVAFKGELDVKEGSSTAAFDFEMDVKKSAGEKAKISFAATEVPGSSLSVDMVKTFTLSSMTFNMSNYDPKGWGYTVTAKASLGSTIQNMTVWFQNVPGGGKYIAASPTGLTLGRLIGADGVPGLNDVALTNVTFGPQVWSLYATFKGEQILLEVQKFDDITKPVVTVSLNSVTLTDFIPGSSSTPLKDVSFEKMMAVYLPGQTEKSIYTLHDKGWPITAVSSIKSTGGEMLKPGLNIFGFMNIDPKGEMKTLLGEVGVSAVKLPLTGKIDKSMFHGNPTAAMKNAIIDNLDINLPLPAISVPGVPDAVNIKHTDLTVKGKNDNGTRSMVVDLAGELDVTHGSTKADFDFDIDIVKKSGVNKLLFSAKETKSSTITADMGIETLDITNLSFGMDNYKPAGWTTWLTGDATVKNNSVHLNYVKDPGQDYRVEITTTGLTIPQLIDSPNLPGFVDVELDSVMIRPNMWFLHGKVHGQDTYFQIQKNPHGPGHLIAAYLYEFALSDLIPGSESSPLSDVTFSNMVALYYPGNQPTIVSGTGILYDADTWIYQSNKNNPTVYPGLNIFGFMNVKPGGEIKTLLGKVGVSEVKLPLNGKIDKSMFHGNPTAQIEDAIMANLDLKLPIPTPKVPELSDVMTFTNGQVEIKGQLPDGTQGIELLISGDASVKFDSSDELDFDFELAYDRASGGGQKELKVSGATTKDWNDPFGMSWIDLKKLNLTFDEKVTGDDSDWDLTVTAKTDIGKHSNLAVTMEVEDNNGTYENATFTLAGPLDLSEIPGIKDIPEVNDLTITSLTASKHGIDAKTTFQGNQTDFFAFEYENEWVIALEQNNFTLTEIVPPLAKTPLKHIKLSEAAIVLTQQKVSGTLSDFGPVAQDAFGTIYGTNAEDEVVLGEGLNLVAVFDHNKATGKAKGGFTKMGMNQNRVVLVGDIGGIMGNSNPHVDLTVVLDSHGRASWMPTWLKFADNIDFLFSIIALESGDDFDVEIGIAMDVNTKIHDDELTFEGKLAMELEEEKADVKFVMDLKNGNLADGGTKDYGLNCTLNSTPGHPMPKGPAGWHDPFGIPGFTLYNIAMDLGVTDDGVHLGFAGGAKVGGDRFCVAVDTDLDAAELGLPQDIAFIGAADQVDMDFPEQLAIQMANDLSKQEHLGISQTDIDAISTLMNGLPAPVFKNVKFAFATPGATDPDLNITGEGVALKGDMYWLGKELGTVDMSVTAKSGIYVDATIGNKDGNLDVGPITIKHTKLDFEVPMPPKNPLNGFFKVNGDIDISEIDLSASIKADVTDKTMSFSVTESLFNDFSESIGMKLTGVDLSVTHPSFDNADFFISGAFNADFGTFIENSMKTTLNTAFSDFDAKLAAGDKKIKAAQAKVDKLNGEINHERAIVRAERAKVEHKVEAAQHRVDELAGDITHDWKKYHHCGGWFPWPCKIRWGITIGFEKAAKDIADEVLKLVEELVKHFPIDMDPRIWPLIAAKETAMGTLKLAEYSIEGLEDLDKMLTKGLDAIENAVGGSVNVKKASFQGSLTGVIEHNDPVDLLIDVELFGSEFEDTFAFKLQNVGDELENLGKEGAKDFAHLSLLGLVGVDHMFNKVLSDIPTPFLRQLRENVGNKIHTAQTALRTDLQADATLFANYSKQAQKLMTDGVVFSNDYVAGLMHAPVTLLDKEPASETFDGAQFEIASSGLCLTTGARYNNEAAEDGYNACAATESDDADYGEISLTGQTFKTAGVNWDTGKHKGKPSGYVYIQSGEGGRCLTVPGKWQFDEVLFDGKIVEQNKFHVSTNWNPGFGNCGSGPENHWKILKHGEDYYQLHNRATQTCLWLQSKQDRYGGVWNSLKMVPCVGANTGVFRVADPVKAVFHKVGLPIKKSFPMMNVTLSEDDDGSASSPRLVSKCFGKSDDGGGAAFVSCDTRAKYDKEEYRYTQGYDLFDYFVDDLGRRRFASRTYPNKCLGYLDDESAAVALYMGYVTCDSGDASQWFATTQTVGGLTLFNTAGGQSYDNVKVRAGVKFPDPWNMLMMPLNPKAGVNWATYSGNAKDKAFTPDEQSTSAINTWVTAWAGIQSKLAANTNDLAAGKQACVESGKKSFCYRLGMQTGYQGVPRLASGAVGLASMPVPGAPNPPPPPVQHLPPIVLTDGTPIIDDDYALAAKNALPNLQVSKEPKWFACRVQTQPQNTSVTMYIPGVVVNNNLCVYSEGTQKYTGGYYDVLQDATDVFWQPSGRGYLPSSAVVTGRINIDKSDGKFDVTNRIYSYLEGQTVAMYTCRTMIGRQTHVGWTIGGKYCHIVNGVSGAVTRNFEVLATSYTQAAPPPPPSPPKPSCTYEMVQEHYQDWWTNKGCTKAQYNKEHPQCNFESRQDGVCDGGPPQNDPYNWWG